jgi:hypothetical protein
MEKTRLTLGLYICSETTSFFYLYLCPYSRQNKTEETSFKSVLLFCTRSNRLIKKSIGEKLCLGTVKGGIKSTMLCWCMATSVSDVSKVFYFFSPGSICRNETGKYYRTQDPYSLKDFDLSLGGLLRASYMADREVSLFPSNNRKFITEQEIISHLMSDELITRLANTRKLNEIKVNLQRLIG